MFGLDFDLLKQGEIVGKIPALHLHTAMHLKTKIFNELFTSFFLARLLGLHLFQHHFLFVVILRKVSYAVKCPRMIHTLQSKNQY